MGAIVAVVEKSGRNAVPSVVAMLRRLMHRGTDAHGVATQTSVKIARSLKELGATTLNSDIAIGYNLSRITSRDVPQPVSGNGYVLVFDGRFFPYTEKTSLEEVVIRLEDGPRKKVLRKVAESLKIPSFIANRTKKAIQYTTGVNKALGKIAKSEDLNISSDLKQLFCKTYPESESPP